jgi:predicted nucleotidyltransferase component of viral defense system
MLKEWLEEYNPGNEEEMLAALREIMQEVALAGLARTDFFEKAALYGGTALRIFYGLDRFSEDLDFSLLETNDKFTLEPYFSAIKTEFEALGIAVSIREKEKKQRTSVESAFLKTETIWQELVIENFVKQTGIKSNKTIKIKIEVDRRPPQGFETEEKLLIRPFSFYVNCFTQPCLFAGKLHALLFRKWNKRVKGRDWYDLEWYIRNGIKLDIRHFLFRARDTGDWKENSISKDQIIALLTEKIESVSFSNVKEDVVRFVKDDSLIELWSAQYFKDLIGKMKFEV